MKRSKIVWWSISSIIGILSIGYLIYGIYQSNLNEKYPIAKNESDIQRHLTSWQNRGGEGLNPKLLEVEHIENTDTYIAFFENQDGQMGVGILKEGANKKLKINNSYHGTGEIKYYWAKTDRGYYGIIYGRNTNKQVHTIKAVAQDNTYSFTVQMPKEEYFMVNKKLQKGADGEEFADLYFYDKNNKEIEIDL